MAYELTATAHDVALAREGDTSYRLTGTVTATSTGWRIDVHPMSDGTVPEADLARWLLHAVPPGEGDTVTFVLTDHPIDVPFEDDAALKTVWAHLQGATTDDGADAIELTVS